MLGSVRVRILRVLVFWGDLAMPLEPVNGIDACYYVIGRLLIHSFFLRCVWKRTRSYDMMPGILASAQDALDGCCCCIRVIEYFGNSYRLLTKKFTTFPLHCDPYNADAITTGKVPLLLLTIL